MEEPGPGREEKNPIHVETCFVDSDMSGMAATRRANFTPPPQTETPKRKEILVSTFDKETMRNLWLQNEERKSLGGGHAGSSEVVAHVCIHGESVVALSKTGLVELSDNKQQLWSIQLSQQETNDWFDLSFVDPFYVALSRSGAIVSIQDNGESDLVGEFENGIQAAAWTEEVLVLVTAGETDGDESILLTMNAQWDVLAEVPIESIAPNTPVSLCWSATNDTIAVSSVDAADGQRKIRLYRAESLELRALGRTEDGSGKLAPNLQDTPIAWANGGCSHLLTAIQTKGRKTTQVAFMEPNGLRHREFSLREEPGVVVNCLAWSSTSDLLAVSLSPADSGNHKVQLWHRSNYHWYQKYELQFQEAIEKVLFRKSEPPLLLMLLKSSRWIEYKFQWDTSHVHRETAFVTDGALLNWTDFGHSVVPPPMYGGTLKLDSCIREMAFALDVYGLVYLSSGSLATVARGKDSGAFAVVAVSLPPEKGWSLRSLVILKAEANCIRFVSVTWDDQDWLLDLTISWTEGSGKATVSERGRIQLPGFCLTITKWEDSPDGVLIQTTDGLLFEYDPPGDAMGILDTSPAAPLMEPCPWVRALQDPSAFGSPETQRLVVGMSQRGRLYLHDMLLSDSVSSFQISLPNKFLVFVTASSRCVLRFLPLGDLCSFDPLLGFDDNNAILQGYEARNVERGSRLVTVLMDKPMVVLQMPRGNLEAISPRALVLYHVITMCLSRCDYKKTFQLMRRQKVDLNLLVDTDPFFFIEEGGVGTFVDQVVTIDHLNLFISSLQNFDSTEEKFKVPSWIKAKKEHNRTFDFSTKVNQVCRAIRNTMLEAEEQGKTSGGRSIGPGHFLLPILSSFAKEDPPRLESALSLIRERTVITDTKSNKPPLFGEAAQNAIEYVAFLADYELLFDTALSSYDYEMARAVARNSQMDPKVYLPLIKQYRELPQYFGRFEVDLKLERYDSALRNLSKSGSLGETVVTGINSRYLTNDFDTCMKLVEDRQLHGTGLELFGDDEGRREMMLNSLGEHLLRVGQPDASLSVFSSAKTPDITRCIKSAKAAMNWRVLFTLLPREEIEEEAEDFVDKLVREADGANDARALLITASRILLDYTSSSQDRAIELLIEAKAWAEANRVGALYSEHNLRKVLHAAVSYSQHCVEDFRERSETFAAARQRYTEVLAIRKEAFRNGEGIDTENEVDETGSQFSHASNASNLSMQSTASTSSVGSLSSVISVKSNSSFTVTSNDGNNRHKSRFNDLGRDQKKKKKRKTRKSNKVRAGSEEELREIIQTMKANLVNDRYGDLLSETIVFLMQNGNLDEARTLYTEFATLFDLLSSTNTDTRVISDGEHIRHPCEAEVEEMKCTALPNAIHELFSCIPSVV